MFKRILLPLDLEEPSSWEKALPVARGLASAHGADLILGTVISDWDAARDAQWSTFAYPRMVKDADARLRSLGRAGGLVDFDAKVAGGRVGPEIVDLAKTVGADLIVLASHRPGPKDYLIGAHALHVVGHAACSVFVVRS